MTETINFREQIAPENLTPPSSWSSSTSATQSS